MRLRTEKGIKTRSFKYKDVVAMQVGQMESVKDSRLMEPSMDTEEFAIKCLKSINEFFALDEKIQREDLTEPNWGDFKKSCNREWHILKGKNPYLRSYAFSEKGWIRLKVDSDTPKEVLDKLGIQSKDRIMLRISKHNERLITDTKLIGDKPMGYIS